MGPPGMGPTTGGIIPGGAIPGGMTPIPGPAVIISGMSAGERERERERYETVYNC